MRQLVAELKEWRWTPKTGGVIAPDERLPWGQTILAGAQHAFAMFGSTVLAPILMGFDPNVAILFSGVATLIFFVVVGGRVPSYLGSSFAFIGVVIAVSGYPGHGPNAAIAIALGGILAAGALYALVGLLVICVGYRWIESLMPPAVTGTIVAVIGLNLAPVAIRNVGAGTLDLSVALFTVVAVGLITVAAPGLLRRVPVMLGGAAGYLLYLLLANAMGLGKPIEFAPIAEAAWFGWPHFSRPSFDAAAMTAVAPVAIILVAENLGHIKAVGAITGRNLDSFLGRAFLGDGLATMIAASAGGTGVTTYAENIGVMAVSKVYSTLIFPVAAGFSLLLGFSPKFGKVIAGIPAPVLGGLSIVVFGLIAATAGRIWVESRVDFSQPRNLLPVAASLTMGAGDLTIGVHGVSISGIGTATFAVIILYQVLRPLGSPDRQ